MNGLSLIDRASLAWKALTTPFSDEGGRAAYGLLAGLLRGSQGPVPERSTLELLATMNTSPWVRACAARVADAKASTQWKLYVGQNKLTGLARADLGYAQKATTTERRKILKELNRAGELREIQTHLFLDIHSRNNDYFTGRDVRWLASVWYDMIGDVLLIKERNRFGKTVSLWPVPPHWVANTPTPERPFYRLAWRAYRAEVPALDMIWMTNPNPVNPYGRGMGLARSIDDEISNDEAASKHTAAHFKNSARPDLLIMPKEGGTFTDPERQRFEEFWNSELQGTWRRFKPLFLKAPVDVKTIEQNFRNLQLRELREHERDVITQTWGIPPELFGIITSSNRSTIEMAPYIFGKYVLEPRLDKDRDFLQYRLIPEYDERLILDYVSPIPEDREFRLKTMQAQPAAFELNEFRQLSGLPEKEELEGRYAASTGAAANADGLGGDEMAMDDEGGEPTDEELDGAVDELADEDAKTVRGFLSRFMRG